MANTHPTTSTATYATHGVERHEDVRHDRFIGTADDLIAASLIEAHQVPGQPGIGKTMAGYLPDGSRVKQGSGSAKTVPGYKRIYKAGNKFVIELRPENSEVARREAIMYATWKQEAQEKAEAAAWREMRAGIARCCFASLRLVWQTEI
jgi:hypothetical protein